MSTTPTPDYGEPWHPQLLPSPISKDKGVYWLNPRQFNRAVDCVNACAGMADPENEIAAMREALEKANNALTLCAQVIGAPKDAEWKSLEECDTAYSSAQSALTELTPFLP